METIALVSSVGLEGLAGPVGPVVDEMLGMVPLFGRMWRASPERLRRWVLAWWLDEAAFPNLGRGPTPMDVKGSLDLHKHWQILHWCLTGTAEEAAGPAGDAILGGEAFGEDLGYGPARSLDPDRVRVVARLLAQLRPAGIVARAGPPPAEICGADFWEEGEGGFREEAERYAGQLCEFYAEAARHGRAVVLWLS